MKAFEVQPEFNKTLLENGVRVVTEHHPTSRATSAGIYVTQGTRDEPADMVGASHFIEHLVFKGTRRRTGYEIVACLEAVGGDLNAYTSREYTCFHGSSLREHLQLSLDVLCDLIGHARFTADDFQKERQVILSEIMMSQEQFEEYVFDLYFENCFGKHKLSRPILGTAKSLEMITRKKIMDFYKDRYHGSNIVVSVAGSVDHAEVVEYVSKHLSMKPTDYKPQRRKPEVRKFRKVVRRPSEQVHILLGLPSASFKSQHRFESYIVNALLGGGMTSRLYQKIREKQALVYSVYSYLHSFTDSGLSMVYAGTSHDKVSSVLKLIRREIEDLRKNGVTRKELDFFKTQVCGNILLGADDIENRMNSLAVNEMVFKKYRPVEDVIGDIKAISTDSVMEYLDSYFDPQHSGLILLGDIDTSQEEEWLSIMEDFL